MCLSKYLSYSAIFVVKQKMSLVPVCRALKVIQINETLFVKHFLHNTDWLKKAACRHASLF